MARRSALIKRLAPAAAFILLFVGLLAVNVLASFIPLRLDVTQDKLYTLSQGTKAILAKETDPVTLKLYYSESLPDVPVAFKTYSRKVIELLREYQADSKGRLTLEIYDPKPDTEDEEWAQRYGVSPARLPNGGNLYFGLVAISEDREAPVPFFDPRRERFLEYDITQAVSRVEQAKKPTIGILSYLPISGQSVRGRNMPEWTLVRELRKSYKVDFLYPNDLSEIPDDIHLLMVVHPKAMPARVTYAIDQFVVRGGKLMVFVDPNSRMDPAAQAGYGPPASSDLKQLFSAWGIQYNPLMVVGDQALATRVNAAQYGVIDYPVWITVHRDNLNRDLPITSELEEMTLIDPGAFAPEKGFKYTFTPLITSSTDSAMVDFTTVRMTSPANLVKMVHPDGKSRVLAALVTGTFSSAFPDGPPPTSKEDKNKQKEATGKKEPKQPRHPFLAKGQRETSVLLVGDADFMADQFSVQTVNFFGNAIQQPLNDNLNFVLNAVEFLTGSQDLIHIRSRGQFSRPFTRVEALRVAASQKFLKEEQQLSQRLEKVKRKLTQIERQKPKGAEKALLSPEQLEEVRKFRTEERNTRKALRDVRKLLREDIETLGNTLLAINLLVMPLLVAVFGFVVIFRRTRRKGRKG